MRTLGAIVACALYAAPAAAQGRGSGAGSTPNSADVKAATDHFKKGEDAFRQKKYSAALEEFKTSYATVASPNSHLYMARCLVALGQYRDAYLEFDKVVAEVGARNDPKYQPTGDTAKTERDELSDKLAFVSVTVKNAPSDATLKVGGATVPPEQWGRPVPVQPGSAEIVVESSSRPPITQTLTVAAGDKKEVTVEAPAQAAPPPVAPPPPPADTGNDRRGLRPFAYAAAGVGVVGLGVFTIAGLMSNSTYSSLKDQCAGPCPPNQGYEDQISKGKTEQTIANVGLVFGVLGVATGATLFVLSVTGGSSSSPKTGSANAALFVGPGSTMVRGRF